MAVAFHKSRLDVVGIQHLGWLVCVRDHELISAGVGGQLFLAVVILGWSWWNLTARVSGDLKSFMARAGN